MHLSDKVACLPSIYCRCQWKKISVKPMMTMDAIFGHQYAHISPKPPVFPTAGCSSFKIQPPCQTRQECCLKMCLGKFFDFGNMYKYNLYRSEKSVESVLNPLSPFGFLVVSNIFYFHPYLGRFPFWLIFFKGVETTNQIHTSPGGLGSTRNFQGDSIRSRSQLLVCVNLTVTGFWWDWLVYLPTWMVDFLW